MVWPRRVAKAVTVTTVAVLVWAVSLVVGSPSLDRVGLVFAAALIAGSSSVSGLLVARDQASSRLGPLLTVPGLLAALTVADEAGQTSGRDPFRDNPYAIAAGQGSWVLIYLAVAVLLLYFPAGRLAGRGERWLLWGLLADSVVFMAVAATAPGPFLPPDESSPHVFGTIPAVLADVLVAVCLPGLLVSLVVLVVLLTRRFRAGDARRRRQGKWLALAGALLPLTLVGVWACYLLFGQATAVVVVGFGSMYLLVPALIAVAVLRPELWDVDRVLASTAAHAVFTTALLAVFTAVNLAAGVVVTDASPVAAVSATILCAIVLAPLRGRLQGRVDRWLYPARKAARVAIGRLHSDTVAGVAGPEELQPVLRTALRDPLLRVGYTTPQIAETVDSDGEALDELVGGGSMAPVWLGAEQIGVLIAGPNGSPELLRDIAADVVPLVELVRLRIELRRALREVEASRNRMLRVGYEERMRLERDLHDGAQQRLVSLGMALRLAQRRLAREDIDVLGVLDEAVAQLGTAVSELRQIAHGIRPSCLDDGLGPALSGLVSSTPIPVSVQVTTPVLDDDLETTAYFVAAEAVSNSVKHARAQHIVLNVDTAGNELRVTVSDDGIGGAFTQQGSGLAGLADRVGAHGGRLAITSPRDGGTTIEAFLPCASS